MRDVRLICVADMAHASHDMRDVRDVWDARDLKDVRDARGDRSCFAPRAATHHWQLKLSADSRLPVPR